jgi:D-alanine-D-alanine ligase
MYPKLWAASGVPYPELVDRLLELAIERNRTLREKATSVGELSTGARPGT